MVPTDEHYSATVNTKESLVEHLSSAEFFDVAAHPTASLTITAATGNTATVDLTIRGTTRAETLTEVVMTTDARWGRTCHRPSSSSTGRDYGVAWAPDMKDAVLEDDIVLSIILVARAGPMSDQWDTPPTGRFLVDQGLGDHFLAPPFLFVLPSLRACSSSCTTLPAFLPAMPTGS
jgi:hypothetical protein